MKKTGKTLRIKMRLTVWKNGKTIVDTFLTKKSTVWARTEATTWDRGYIKVDYGDGCINESEHENRDRLLLALTAYTEKPLLDYVERTS